MMFHLNWWAFKFPDVGFTLATIKIGGIFEKVAVGWVGSVRITCLAATYLLGVAMCVRAVLGQKIISKRKDEDTYLGEEKPKVRREKDIVAKVQEKTRMIEW
jgi:tellurite resistance protein TehA-like permease